MPYEGADAEGEHGFFVGLFSVEFLLCVKIQNLLIFGCNVLVRIVYLNICNVRILIKRSNIAALRIIPLISRFCFVQHFLTLP